MVVNLVPVKDFILANFFIQNIASVRFVNDDQIKVGDSGHGVLIIVQNSLHHTLNRGNLDAGFTVYLFLFQSLDIINIIQCHQFFQLNFSEYIARLFT